MIDSHLHLTCKGFTEEELPGVLERAWLRHIEAMVTVCTDLDSLLWALKLAEQEPRISVAAAIPPHDLHLAYQTKEIFTHLDKLVAIGETGLEYFHQPVDKVLQRELFCTHLQKAEETQLPLIIHCRDAFEDFFDIIDEFSLAQYPGVLHCFTGGMEDAKRLIDRNWMISFSGILTFKKSVELQEIAQALPIKNILIETDAPYLAPQTERGKRNEPAFLMETAKMLASLQRLPLETVMQETARNTRTLFNRML